MERLVPYDILLGLAFDMVEEDSYAEECVGYANEVATGTGAADRVEVFLATLAADAAMIAFPPDPALPLDHPDNAPAMRRISRRERLPLLRALTRLRRLAAIDNPRRS